jgi:hypothetical protein
MGAMSAQQRGLVVTEQGWRIYFLTRRIAEPYYELPSTDVYFVPARGGEPQRAVRLPAGEARGAARPDRGLETRVNRPQVEGLPSLAASVP